MESDHKIGVIRTKMPNNLKDIERTVHAPSREGSCEYQFNAAGQYYFSSGTVSDSNPELAFSVTVNVNEKQSEEMELHVKVKGSHFVVDLRVFQTRIFTSIKMS